MRLCVCARALVIDGCTESESGTRTPGHTHTHTPKVGPLCIRSLSRMPSGVSRHTKAYPMHLPLTVILSHTPKVSYRKRALESVPQVSAADSPVQSLSPYHKYPLRAHRYSHCVIGELKASRPSRRRITGTAIESVPQVSATGSPAQPITAGPCPRPASRKLRGAQGFPVQVCATGTPGQRSGHRGAQGFQTIEAPHHR
jgi:hypothetical protein